MRPIICDCCQIRIDDSWAGPALVVEVHNGVDTDVSGDYCVDCAGSVAAAIRSVIEANNRSNSEPSRNAVDRFLTEIEGNNRSNSEGKDE